MSLSTTTRTPLSGHATGAGEELEAVTAVFDQELQWDAANNLVRQVDYSGDWKAQSVAGYMTDKVQTVIPNTSITTALLKMTAGRFRQLPIVDRDGKPMGIVSIRDIISHIAHCYPKDFVNLPPSPDHEPKAPWGG